MEIVILFSAAYFDSYYCIATIFITTVRTKHYNHVNKIVFIT